MSIVTIIPAPLGLAHIEVVVSDDGTMRYHTPLICLALEERNDGVRLVTGLTTGSASDGSGYSLEDCEPMCDFVDDHGDCEGHFRKARVTAHD